MQKCKNDWPFIVFCLSDEKSSFWWKIIDVMKIYQCVESVSIQWKFISEMKIYQIHEDSLIWWKPSIVIESIFAENFLFDENFPISWKLVAMRKSKKHIINVMNTNMKINPLIILMKI